MHRLYKYSTKPNMNSLRISKQHVIRNPKPQMLILVDYEYPNRTPEYIRDLYQYGVVVLQFPHQKSGVLFQNPGDFGKKKPGDTRVFV